MTRADIVTVDIERKLHEKLVKEAKDNDVSLRKYVNELLLAEMQKNELLAKHIPKIEKISVDDDRVILKDNIKNRIAEIIIQKGELLCQLCNQKDCVHIGFVFSLPELAGLKVQNLH